MIHSHLNTEQVEDALRAISTGEMETFPLAFVQARMQAEAPGEKLRVWRNYRGLSKAELGRRTGITGQYLRQIEAGRREGSVGLFKRLAEILRCEMDDLV
jgi:DNA-binding XRE family transcriptional regulator